MKQKQMLKHNNQIDPKTEMVVSMLGSINAEQFEYKEKHKFAMLGVDIDYVYMKLQTV